MFWWLRPAESFLLVTIINLPLFFIYVCFLILSFHIWDSFCLLQVSKWLKNIQHTRLNERKGMSIYQTWFLIPVPAYRRVVTLLPSNDIIAESWHYCWVMALLPSHGIIDESWHYCLSHANIAESWYYCWDLKLLLSHARQSQIIQEPRQSWF